MTAHCYRQRLRDAEDHVLASFRLAAEKGVDVLSTQLRDWQDPARLELYQQARADAGIDLEAGWGYDFVHGSADDAARALERLAAMIDGLCRPLEIRVIGTCARTHRWVKDPPLEEQLHRITEALRPAARLCAGRGVALALENHADYRGHEIARIVREVDSDGLGARLDSGNAFWTFEDPLDAAEALAPLAVGTHMKDLRILPPGKWEGAALGEGDVNIRRVVELLVAHAPDLERLTLMAEVEAIPPDVDQEAASDRSLAYLRELIEELDPARKETSR